MNDFGDGTVSYNSALGIKNGKAQSSFQRKVFKDVGHIPLIKDDAVLTDVCKAIKGESIGGQAITRKALAELSPEGMSPYVKLHVMADKLFDVRILDRDSNLVASVIDDRRQGFDGENFIHMSTVEDGTRALIYMPNSGYKVVFSRGEAEGEPANMAVEVATLDREGFNTSMATYVGAQKGEDGEILTLDMLSGAVNEDNLGALVEGESTTPVVFHDKWEIEPEYELPGVGDSITIELSGEDVAAGNVTASDLSWSSSNPEIASVSETGDVTSNAPGEAVIFASALDKL
ncbi:MAG: Ig-like domain-containing protein [Synergistaceae bacterium]|nr:Ig-like domain-containing protein [Synergistaceae bacterium]